MARARTVRCRGEAERYSDALTLLEQSGDYALVIRGVARSLVMQCPDGCGETITVNLDRRMGPAWRLYRRAGRATVYPSVWRESGCRAHFIIWEDRLLWCDGRYDTGWNNPELVAAVRRALPGEREDSRHYEDIAAHLGAVPWEVLWACEKLARSGEASAEARGTRFRARSTALGASRPLDRRI